MKKVIGIIGLFVVLQSCGPSSGERGTDNDGVTPSGPVEGTRYDNDSGNHQTDTSAFGENRSDTWKRDSTPR
jgi:hypothetical protein